MQKKYQIFVSSTYTDLIEERQDALKAILDIGHIASGMEGFFAADEEQLNYIKRIIDECDYYVLIIAGKYGSADEHGISYTEREYDYAVSKGIPVLAFIHNDVANIPAGKVDTETEKLKKLELFKNKVSQRRIICSWNKREELKSNIIISLTKRIGEVPRIGWVRGNAVASEDILLQINSLRNELEQSRIENSQLKAELKPKIDNIAQLNETFPLNYSYYIGNTKYKKNVELTWEEIFKITGPSFYTPKQTPILKACLEDHINNFIFTEYRPSLLILDNDIDTIKIQLTAYGFIDICEGTALGGGQFEFLKLTDLGKQVLMEFKTLKSTLMETSA